MRNAMMIAGLLLTAGIAVTPTASADHCTEFMLDPPAVCHAVFETYDRVEGILPEFTHAAQPAVDYAMCFIKGEPIANWGQCL